MIDLSHEYALIDIDEIRPRTRAECPPKQDDGTRPCPWVGCRHHLAVDIDGRGRLKIYRPHIDPTDWPMPCALDHADRGGMTLEEIGELLGVSRERVRQIDEQARRAFRYEWEE